jgi:hypothetical protein
MRRARRLAAALLAMALPAAAAPSMPGRAFHGSARATAAFDLAIAGTTYRWEGPVEKSAAVPGERRVPVGAVRPAAKDAAAPDWREANGGHVARFDVASAGALGLRVRLDLEGAGALELRVREPGGRVIPMAVAAGAAHAWGPWTPGDRQEVEVFSASRPGPGAVRLGAVAHFDRPLDAKAAGECTMDTRCPTGDAPLDAAIAVRKKSTAKISLVDDGRAFVCSGTLIDTEKFPAPYFLTATHCVGRPEVAASVTSFWFHEASECGGGSMGPDTVQVGGGMTLVFADPNTDHSLLRMNADPADGAVFSGWDASRLGAGDAVVSISHPAGDVSKWALATVTGTARFREWEQPVWLTRFSRGVIQGGSSGSGLFVLEGGTLRLRAVLSATTVGANGGLSCANTGESGIYNRLDVFYPQVARYLQANPLPVADDHGNRPSDATAVAVGAAGTRVGGRIDYAGDVDVLRIDVSAPGTLVAEAEGGEDTVGLLLDSRGERLASNDDARADALDFGITWRVSPGTYYLVVSRWESAGTADYAVRFLLEPNTDNYTDLWWNPAEPGWGLNLNHQGAKLFATLFTYEPGGAPLWLVMSDGPRQPDGSYQGTLFRTKGPAFNAVPWTGATTTTVGTMRLEFPAPDRGVLTYVFDGVTVVKPIERQRFSESRTACSWQAFDRGRARNFQDLWWNPAEPGWGINFAHQGDTLFATLFTYRADGRTTWYVMSNGVRKAGAYEYTGTLFRTAGPAFDASPWTPATTTEVGTMTASFSSGTRGTLAYAVDGVAVSRPIERQVFASPATECEGVDDD